ncbi:cytochrome c oxidase subunit II [Natrinema pallidum]|uniref:Cytochrome c oxidase subunit II n=2 Tax=Natrinema pallidum TaxID=69527 RepID=L9YGI0_9EURY|nr:cytochrome c oxidase subunit II [Natrinema pallidum]ELY72652.1 cytochrome c oxidase subunit II [Natrinema pallidum DSM 3751]QCW04523.1 cytochrome C oxidase subunit II [Natrinema pallidum]
MNIHTYEKAWLVAAMVLIVGFIATITYGAVGPGIAMIDDDAGSIDPNEISDHERFGETGVEHLGGNEYEVNVVAQAWSYSPSEIEVPAGSEVTFYVTSRDVTHSFTVVGTNVNTMVVPGQISEMTVQFDEPGEYGILCNEYCGEGHHTMEGLLTVVPEDEFDLTELSTDAPREVEAGNETTINATVSNGMQDGLETTATLEIGEQQYERDVTIDGEGSAELTFDVDTDALGEGEHDWTLTVDDHEESGTLSVVSGTDGGDTNE